MKNFKQKALEIIASEPSVSNEVLSELMGDEIDFWHMHERIEMSLSDYLGLSFEEYERFLRTSDVREILALS